MSTTQRRALLLAAGVVPLLRTASAHAGAFPTRPIRFIVPFPPGSVTDVSARYYATRLTALAGQAAVVENRPGANGLIGVSATLSAPADGYTVLIGTTSTLATNVALYRRLPYDPLTDLAPVGLMSVIPTVLVTHRDSRYRSLQDVITAAKAAPGQLNYASGATSYQLMGELFNEQSAVQTTAIPYKGSADALNAVLANQVDFAILDLSTALAPIRNGLLHALAVASERRVNHLPDVPTAIESGVPDYLASTWVAAMVSARTPQAELRKLQAWCAQVATAAKTREFFHNIGAEVMPGDPVALRTLQQQSIALWRRVAASAGIELL